MIVVGVRHRATDTTSSPPPPPAQHSPGGANSGGAHTCADPPPALASLRFSRFARLCDCSVSNARPTPISGPLRDARFRRHGKRSSRRSAVTGSQTRSTPLARGA
jgi:hypothetical protein